MNRLSFLAIGFALVAAGCGSSTTSPSSQNTVVFTAALSPANEVPPITNADSTGSGNMTITFHLTRDSGGNITAATADFAGAFNGFPAGTSLVGAHIHVGAAGANGGIQVSANVVAGDVVMPNGSGSLSRTNITVTPPDLANQIINNPAGYYFNIHSTINPGGAARGQLVKQ